MKAQDHLANCKGNFWEASCIPFKRVSGYLFYINITSFHFLSLFTSASPSCYFLKTAPSSHTHTDDYYYSLLSWCWLASILASLKPKDKQEVFTPTVATPVFDALIYQIRNNKAAKKEVCECECVWDKLVSIKKTCVCEINLYL